MKSLLKYSLPTMILVLAFASVAKADPWKDPNKGHNHDPHGPNVPSAPEVDPAMAMSGLALVAGAAAVIRTKTRKR